MQALTELHKTLRRITDLQEIVSTSRDDKNRRARYFTEMRVGFDEYGNRRRVHADALEIADKVNAVILREIGDHLADRHLDTLKAAAREIDALRAVLPQLAAKASIELGVLARGFEQEAKNND